MNAPAVASRLDTIRKRGGIRSREVAQLLDTTPETISRWQRGRVEPGPDRLQRLLTLEWLIEQLSDLYAPDEARLWLFSHHRLLHGDRPADRIQHGQVDDVLALIAQLRDGAYT
jgi:transcriptional regulator with XRE-family HTH domain